MNKLHDHGFLRIWHILGDPNATPPVAPIIPVGRSTWWEGVRIGRFPPPVKLGPRTSAWRASEILELAKDPQGYFEKNCLISSVISKNLVFPSNLDQFEAAKWLDGLADWRIAITLTIKRKIDSDVPRSRGIIVRTMQDLMYRINKKCFNHQFDRDNYRIAVAYAIETNFDGSHPHVHGTISIPPNYSEEKFVAIVSNLITKFRLIDKQVNIQKYHDSEWMSYCIKNGFENLVVEHIQQAHP